MCYIRSREAGIECKLIDNYNTTNSIKKGVKNATKTSTNSNQSR